jgi:iron complex outermembrane receptor protein
MAFGIALPEAKAQNAAVQINLPAQPLAQALLQLGKKTSLQIFYPQQLVQGLQAPAISGHLTPEQALRQLLQGTGINYSRQGDSVILSRPASEEISQLAPVTVTGFLPGALRPAYAGGQVATGGQVGMLGNKDVMDTPFSQTNYTNKTIKNQQAQTVQDVLSNDPSIVTKLNVAYDDDSSITIRGFSTALSSGFASLNGLAGMSPLSAPDMDYIERVEVLRGPSALLNGMAASGAGGLGGTYNLVTKQAGDEPLTELTTRYESRSQLGAHVDVGRRFGAENQFGLRFNGAYRKGDGPVDPQSLEVGSAALNLDYRGERVRIAADFMHQANDADPQNIQQLSATGARGGVAFIPKAPDAGTSLNPSWSKQRSRLTGAMLRGEVDLADNVTAYAAIGKQKWDFSYSGPRQPTLRAVDGTYGWNNLSNTNYASDVLSMQGGLRAAATTGPVNHALSLNLTQSRREVGLAETTSPYTYTTNLYDPIFGPEVFIADPGSPQKSSETRVSSVGVADTLSILDERVQLTAGVRYQEVESDNFNTTTGAKTSSYDGKAWTPALGLIVKPWQNVSLYANYIENLQAGTIVGTSYANAGQVFSPYVSKQHEAGVKVDWGTVTTTLAAFQIAQPNTVSIDDPAGGLPTLSLDGEQRNRGLELNAYGEPMRGFRLMGGVTLLDARLTKTQGGLNDGNRADGAPVIRTVVGAEWDTPFLQGLTLTGRVTYTGDQVATSNTDDLKIPSWTVVHLGARYVFDSPWNNKPITVRFNVDNVFNKNYWSGVTTRYIQLGAPRIYRLSATFAF